jgi:hypothetical protein
MGRWGDEMRIWGDEDMGTRELAIVLIPLCLCAFVVHYFFPLPSSCLIIYGKYAEKDYS